MSCFNDSFLSAVILRKVTFGHVVLNHLYFFTVIIFAFKFGEIQEDIYQKNNELYLSTEQLGACLGYTQPKTAISKIVKKCSYLKDKEFSGITKTATPQGGTQNTRIFTEDGIYEITMLAKT